MMCAVIYLFMFDHCFHNLLFLNSNDGWSEGSSEKLEGENIVTKHDYYLANASLKTQ